MIRDDGVQRHTEPGDRIAGLQDELIDQILDELHVRGRLPVFS